MAKRPTITLVGRAHGLAFTDDTATWQIAVRRTSDPSGITEFNLTARQAHVLEQFESMDEGQLIGVIAELPPAKDRKPGVPLAVTRLEILGKPQQVLA